MIQNVLSLGLLVLSYETRLVARNPLLELTYIFGYAVNKKNYRYSFLVKKGWFPDYSSYGHVANQV